MVPTVLAHSGAESDKCSVVECMDWQSAGTMLATGSMDGWVRVWNKSGTVSPASFCTVRQCPRVVGTHLSSVASFVGQHFVVQGVAAGRDQYVRGLDLMHQRSVRYCAPSGMLFAAAACDVILHAVSN